MFARVAIGLLALASVCNAQATKPPTQVPTPAPAKKVGVKYFVAQFPCTPQSCTARGYISMHQNSPSAATTISVHLKNMSAALGPYTWHVHENRVNGTCASTGGHYDPTTAPTLGELTTKHGSLVANASITKMFSDKSLPLSGPNSILHRSIVIHTAAGARYACATIMDHTPHKNAGKCLDAKYWKSKSGATCGDYAKHHYCLRGGSYGKGWQSSWGTFQDDANRGLNATKACCACGGGKRLAVAKWACHHSKDCVHGTCHATTFGKVRASSCICHAGWLVSPRNKSKGVFSCTRHVPYTHAPTTAPCSTATFAARVALATDACGDHCNVSVTMGMANCTSILLRMPRIIRNVECAKAFTSLHSSCKTNLASAYRHNQSHYSSSKWDYYDRTSQHFLANYTHVDNITNCRASLSQNLGAVNRACCTSPGMCNSAHPMPISCTEGCGAVFQPWFKQCGHQALSGARYKLYKMMANFNHVCSREGTTCSSYLNCSALRRNAVVAKSAGMDWHTSSGSNDMVCGESEIAFYTKGNMSTNQAQCYGDNTDKNTWQTASHLCGRMGARMCSMDEMLNGETAGTGCGSQVKLAWTRSAGACPRGQYMAVASAPGQSAVGAECRNKTDSLEVRCCADVNSGRGRHRNVCAGSVRPAKAVQYCTSAVNCSSLHARFGGWGEVTHGPTGPAGVVPTGHRKMQLQGSTSCGEADNGLAKGVSKCYGNQGEKLRNGFYSAFSICANIGARMCRASELVASVGSDTGCGHNGTYIWAMSTWVRMPNGSHFYCNGSKKLAIRDGDGAPRCLNATGRESGVAAVRCCADNAVAGNVCRGSRALPERGAAYKGCTSALSCAQLKGGYGGWPLSHKSGIDSSAVCGESDNGMQRAKPGAKGVAKCVHESNATQRNGWATARHTCGVVGARLCTVEELVRNEAADTCEKEKGHERVERVWSSSMANCPIGFYWAVKGHLPECVNKTASLGVRCCADAAVATKKICPGTYTHAKAPPALSVGDICQRLCHERHHRGKPRGNNTKAWYRCSVCPAGTKPKRVAESTIPGYNTCKTHNVSNVYMLCSK